ncbi:unnamed protein product [Chilo suppressalis]|uniref:Uncharacterized protein n=1 Tax=Chilo suppressalis TaxID=168631 RepID=A0ABN8AX09_CHISP|nr:unnamed protein product [Chilo suppressalis]
MSQDLKRSYTSLHSSDSETENEDSDQFTGCRDITRTREKLIGDFSTTGVTKQFDGRRYRCRRNSTEFSSIGIKRIPENEYTKVTNWGASTSKHNSIGGKRTEDEYRRMHSSDGGRYGRENRPGNKEEKEEDSQKSNSRQSLEEKETLGNSPGTSAAPESFLGTLELMWTTDIYNKIMKALKMCEQKGMELKNLLLKREFMKLISLWKTILKSIIHKLRETKCEGLSWNAFRTILHETELYTSCLQFKMTDIAIELFHQFVNQEAHTKEASSGLLITPTTTSTSCTTVPMRETVAVANESKISEPNVESPDLIAELFGIPNAQRNTGSISQSISKAINGVQYTLKSPGEYGQSVIKLETYPFAKIANLDKKHWWKHAETKMIFLTASNVDPTQITVNKLISQVTKNVTTIPNVSKEQKEISYWNSFGDFQRRQ